MRRLTMGRKRKYQTEEEKKEAQRKWQMDHYHRNKEQILQKARDNYKKKKREKMRRERSKRLYGDQ